MSHDSYSCWSIRGGSEINLASPGDASQRCNYQDLAVIDRVWVMDGTGSSLQGDDPTPHQLRLLLVLAEELHFGRAARRVYLTQPALSQQIRALEQRLGVRLFDRTSRRVELTPIALKLLPLARSIVDSSEQLREMANHATTEVRILRIGVCESFTALGPTRQIIDGISTRFPELGPRVQVIDTFTEQLAALERGEIHAAFVHVPVPSHLHVVPLVVERRVACLAATDPLARRESLRLADLAHHAVVTMVPESFPEGRAYWAADPRPDGRAVRYATAMGTTFESMLATVALTGAVAFVPASAAQLYPRPDLRFVPVDALADCTFGIVWRSSETDEPRMAGLREVVAAVAGQRSRSRYRTAMDNPAC
ncbi:LysR family transcriptional regulator [Nocardia sp. NPDC056541]|uniref:LysR family transcriptional regulator n=1 Tax=Nocardia sp. NPDC056541 TaxID=3345860 RepID=UPI0036734F1C